MGLKSLVILAVVVVASTNARPSDYQGEKRLIRTSASEPATWLTQAEIYSLIENNVGFMDQTNRVYPVTGKEASSSKALPTTLRYQTTVAQLLTKLNSARQEAFVETYSAYNNRHYQSATGVEASKWLLSQIQESIDSITYGGKIDVAPVSHTWAQDSIIARIEGADPTLKSEVIVLGAHLDSIASGVNGRAPGADDNASGSVVLLETLRVILESGFIPKRTLEFQWYAAEEVGLWGSQDIAESYYNLGVDVIAMINFDVVGYYVEGKDDIAVYTDNTDRVLSQFIRTLVTGYLEFGWTNMVCGYGCSDHASWNEYGFPAAFPGEVVDNPYMHTTGDTIARVNFKQVLEFTKLAVGFAVEIAEPL